MNDQNLKELVINGLTALNAAFDLGKQATDEIQNDASDSQLKQHLQTGSQKSQEWQQKVETALNEAGASGQKQDNPVIQAHYEVSKRIRAQAKSPETRDLGIIADGQLVMHYFIASFGTLRAYAQRLGMDETARNMQTLLDESKQADDDMTQMAQRIMGGTGVSVGANNASVR